MFDAQYILSGALFSPWTAREGDNVVIHVDLVGITKGTLTVQLFHKNEEDDGPGRQVSIAEIEASKAGVDVVGYYGLDELVRYKFIYTLDASNVLDHALFRMLDPVWFDTVNAG